MIILFANQKGGVGKSTLAMFLANYLSLAAKKDVVVLDLDDQQSLYQKYIAALGAVDVVPYCVERLETAKYKASLPILNGAKGVIKILDTGAGLRDDNLIDVYKSADVVVVPFWYEEFVVNSTIDFLTVIRAVNKKVPIVLVPNNIKATTKNKTVEVVNEVLVKFGEITAALPDWVEFKRGTTFCMPSVNLVERLIPVFGVINKYIKEV